MPRTFQKGRAMEKSTSRVMMAIIMCMMMLGTRWALPTCYQYPRYFVSSSQSNFILSMDMHFQSDLLVYVGHSMDYYLNRNAQSSNSNIPVVAAMSIANPIFKWTLSAIQWTSQSFSDVDISDDGAKVVVAGTYTDSQSQVILWVLNAVNGVIISQKVVKVLDPSSTPYPLTNKDYKQILIRNSESVIYLLMRTNTPNTSIYLAKVDYSASSTSPLWSLKTDPAQVTQAFSQITYGGSSSTNIEDTLYVVVPVGSKYQLSRIAESGAIQWTYEFPLSTYYTIQFFIEYALNAVSSGDNTLVIATHQYYIAVVKISSTESQAAAGPVHLSRKLYQEYSSKGATCAIYVKPSSDFVYLLNKLGSQYFIGSFQTSSSIIYYKEAFYSCYAGDDFKPRGIFKDENNYFASLNCAAQTNYYYIGYPSYTMQYFNIGTGYFGGLILASSKTQYSSCYEIPTSYTSSYYLYDYTYYLLATSSSGEWQTIANPTPIEVTDDPNGSTTTLQLINLKQNTDFCPVHSHQVTSVFSASSFINYVSNVPSQFSFPVPVTQVCIERFKVRCILQNLITILQQTHANIWLQSMKFGTSMGLIWAREMK